MSDLRLDYSVECEQCGAVEDTPKSMSEATAQQYLYDKGWRLVEDENRCQECAGVK